MLAWRLLCSVPLFLFRARESLPACLPAGVHGARCAVRVDVCPGGGCRSGLIDAAPPGCSTDVDPCPGSPSSDPPTTADQVAPERILPTSNANQYLRPQLARQWLPVPGDGEKQWRELRLFFPSLSLSVDLDCSVIL